MSGDRDTAGLDTRRTEAEPAAPWEASFEPALSTLTEFIDRYVVLGPIGRGGMGWVLRAYDPKLQREVALKILHRDVLDKEAQARLVREARAMAQLSHPNVVSIYDVQDSPSGVVLVMELVRGKTLRAWLRERARPWAEVVGRFVEAGRGLVAAHAEGLMHRDFKPSNVLVPDHGEAKVTDFGLAKIAQESATKSGTGGSVSVTGSRRFSDPGLTRDGTVLGTPTYMAPEQHLGEPLGASVDQFAFCVALWEALTGRSPFEGTAEALVNAKLSGSPAWPEGLSVPRPVVEALRRGLAPRPEARWPSTSALLDALAYDPARRRRRTAIALAGVGLLGLGGAAAYGWDRAQTERCAGAEAHLEGVWDDERRDEVERAVIGTGVSYASDVWARIEPRLAEFAEAWATMHTQACEATTIRGEQSPEVMDLRMACLHAARLELRAAVDVLAAADPRAVGRAHEVVAELPPLERCADVPALRAELAPPSPAEAQAVDRIREALASSHALRLAGRYEQAEASIERARSELRRIEYGPIRPEVRLEEGRVLEGRGEYAAAEAAYRAALEGGARHGRWDVARDASIVLVYVVSELRAQPQEALRYRDLAEGLVHEDPAAEADLLDNLGTLLSAKGEFSAAEVEYRKALALRERALGPAHLALMISHINLAATLDARGHYAESEAEARVALDLGRQLLGARHPDLASSYNNLAIALSRQGRDTEAEDAFRRALELRREALGEEHPTTTSSRNNLGANLLAQGKYAEAEAELRQVLAVERSSLGPAHPDMATTHHNLALALSGQGQYAEAERSFRHALAVFDATLDPSHPERVEFVTGLASILRKQGRNAEAELELRQALAKAQEVLDTDHPQLALTRTTLAEVLLALGRANEALPVAEQAWARRRREGVPPDEKASAAFVLARARAASGVDRPGALSLAREALALYEQQGPSEAERAREVKAWLRRQDG